MFWGIQESLGDLQVPDQGSYSNNDRAGDLGDPLWEEKMTYNLSLGQDRDWSELVGSSRLRLKFR